MGNHSSSSNGGHKTYNHKEPLRFHSTHSENVKLFNEGLIARRVDSFCKGICFSARPIVVGEPVILRVSHISTNWSGFLRVGFTGVDPSTRSPQNLPRYACPDMTNLAGNWAKALPERYGKLNNVISYYVNRAGEVYLSINGDELPGPFFNGVSISGSLWALIDIYGNATGVEFLEKTFSICSSPSVSPAAQSDSALARSQSTVARIPLASPTKHYTWMSFRPLLFHNKVGRAVNLNHDKTVATRHTAEYSNAYVFTERPVNLSEKVVLQILSLDSAYRGGLTVGMTACDPMDLRQQDLPDDSDNLLDRPEYWVVHKDVLTSTQVGDEICFSLVNDGEVIFEKNGVHVAVIMHVDKTIPLWLFLDLYGQFSQVKLFGVVDTSQSRSSGAPALARPPLQHRSVSVPDTAIRKPLIVELPPAIDNKVAGAPPIPPRLQRAASTSGASAFSAHSTAISQDRYKESTEADENMANECAVCFEKPCDAVLYTCGHLCMCHECAQSVKSSTDPLCPICRQEIKDVIRIYKS